MYNLVNFLIPGQSSLLKQNFDDFAQLKTENTYDYNQRRGLARLCIHLAMSAFTYYIQRDLTQFDALVGENCCQIRAYKIQEMVENETIDDGKLSATINKMHAIAQKIINKGVLNAEDHLDLFSDDEKFLIFSHLLTCTRNSANPGRTDNNKLQDLLPDLQISNKNVGRIVDHAKKSLAQMSTLFVRKLKVAQTSLYQKLLEQTENTGIPGIDSTALFYNFKVILETLKVQQSVLMIQIDQKNKYFFRTSKKGVFEPIENTDQIHNKPAFVICFKTQSEKDATLVIQQLLNGGEDLEKSLLAHAAEHPLFPGKINSQKEMHIFEHEILQNIFAFLEEKDLENIAAHLADLPQEVVEHAQKLCEPVSLNEVIRAYFEREHLKINGSRLTKVIKIVHVYVSMVERELMRSHLLTTVEEK